MAKLTIIPKALSFVLLLNIAAQISLTAQTASDSPAIVKGLIVDAEEGRINGASVPVESKKQNWTLQSEFVINSPRSASPQSAPNIGVNGYASTDKVPRGHIVQVAVVMDIPGGYHVNSNRPLESFLVATQLKVEAPGGVRVGPVAYPRALLRKFSFSNDKLSVYEGRAVLRFNVTVPANFGAGSMELKAKLRYQSCSDTLCFPPQSREVKVEIPVVAANEAVKRINGEYFGRGR